MEVMGDNSKTSRLWRPVNDDTLPYSFKVSDVGGLPQYVNRVFGLAEGRVFDKVDALVLLCAVAHGFITTEELMSIYPVSRNKVSAILSDHSVGLTGRRDIPEYFERCTFSTPVEQSKVFYRLTKLGFKRAAEISERIFEMKYRPSKQESFLHPYGMGKNLFSLIPLATEANCFMRMYYEVSDQQKGYLPKDDTGLLRDSRGGLFTDAVVYFYNNEDRKFAGRVYIEQDTGAEHAKTLVSKLQRYYDKGFLDMNRYGDVIAFSVLERGVYTASSLLSTQLKAASFRIEQGSLSYLRTVSKGMRIMGHRTIGEYLLSCENGNIKRALEDFEQTVNVGKTDISFNHLTADFIDKYIQYRMELRDPYLIRQFDLVNLKLSRSIMAKLADYYVYGDGRKGFQNTDTIVTAMLHGFSVICAPTSLMGSALSFFVEIAFKRLWAGKIGAILRQYFPGVSYSSDKILISHGRDTFNLRNVFGIEKNSKSYVCVEFPCYDIGAWVRVYRFMQTQPREKDNEDFEYARKLPYSVVCILDNLEQVEEFFNFMKIEYPYDEVRPGYGGIFAMVRSDLTEKGKAPRLFRGFFNHMKEKFVGSVMGLRQDKR